ncbi:hypothetical protein FH5_04409 [Priestia endophytica]|jgi:hypothetical protein|nr:hypothetical protein FH5_04409 [Priestia endophytica]
MIQQEHIEKVITLEQMCEDLAIGEMRLKEELEKYLEVVYDVKFS